MKVKHISSSGFTVSVADLLRTKVDGLLHQVQAAHAKERHRDDLSLLQAILPQQLGHGLSPKRNVVSCCFFFQLTIIVSYQCPENFLGECASISDISILQDLNVT